MAKEQSIEKQIRSLITNECANHFSKCDNTNNYCCLEWTKDLQCIYFQTEPEQQRCGYFEESVLSLSEELKVIYNLKYIENINLTTKQQKEIKQDIDWANRPRKKCGNCGEIFPAKSNRQKLCDKCGILKRKEKERERQAELRKNKKAKI